MLPKLRFFLRQALSALGRSFGVTVLSVGTTGVALAVLATFAVIVTNLARVAAELGKEVEVSVYLAKSTAPESGNVLAKIVSDWPEVARARFLDAESAMREFEKSLGKDAILLEGLPRDVLPPSLELELVPRPWTSVEVAVLGRRLAQLEGVQDVRYGQDDIEKVHALLGYARVTAGVLGLALCLATILVVSNTIRLTVYARRDEIEIMSLVGATNAFVRAPFVLEGAIQGVLGGGFALALLVGLEELLEVGLERGLSYAYGPIELDFVPLSLLGWLLAAGFALGLVGSVLAVGKFLRV